MIINNKIAEQNDALLIRTSMVSVVPTTLRVQLASQTVVEIRTLARFQWEQLQTLGGIRRLLITHKQHDRQTERQISHTPCYAQQSMVKIGLQHDQFY